MKLLFFASSIFVLSTSIFFHSQILSFFTSFTSPKNSASTPRAATTHPSMSSLEALKSTMSKALSHAKIVPRRSADRGHANHGWLNSYHTFSFANYYDPRFQNFGSLRVLNEDRVEGGSGFPTHPHRDAEIFSYILSGELTHRDSMIKKGTEGTQGDDFFRMKRGDVQFTTGGSGIAHSEQNEAEEQVHFLQIWALPWSRGLTPRYHTRTFPEDLKRVGFLPILSPLVGGQSATPAQEKAAKAVLPDTIPIHADFVMGAGIIPVDKRFKWTIGADAVTKTEDRHVYIHLPMTKNGSSKIRIDGREDAVLSEGDGAFISGVNAGDVLSVESVGEAEAEVVVLDSD
ncbi:pirin domain protein [Diplocarpon rosae]|nr:pirin domain protein [Diplocarpon rosae]